MTRFFSCTFLSFSLYTIEKARSNRKMKRIHTSFQNFNAFFILAFANVARLTVEHGMADANSLLALALGSRWSSQVELVLVCCQSGGRAWCAKK